MLGGDLAFFVALGFAAHLIDGALGIPYDLIATSVLLASGAPPAIASASVHAAEVMTIGLAGASQIWHGSWTGGSSAALLWLVFWQVWSGPYILTELPDKQPRPSRETVTRRAACS